MTKRDITAGIVSYNPDVIRLKENIDACLDQIDSIIIIDNGSRNIEEIEELIAGYNSLIQLYCLGENKGIAYALNELLYYSKAIKKKWLLTLDQDSVLVAGIVQEYVEIVQMIDNVAMVSCVINDRSIGMDIEYNNKKGWEYIDQCITSGSFINIDKMISIDGFDDSMFIDYVDFDICKRIILNDFHIIRVNKIGLLHEVGRAKNVTRFGTKVIVYNHNPLRIFYQARNRVYYARKYKKFLSFKQKIKMIKVHFDRILNIIMFEENKRRKIDNYFKGLQEGVTCPITEGNYHYHEREIN